MAEITSFMETLNRKQPNGDFPDSHDEYTLFELKEPFGMIKHHKHFSEDGYGMTNKDTIFYIKSDHLITILNDLKDSGVARFIHQGGRYFSYDPQNAIPHLQRDGRCSFEVGNINGKLSLDPTQKIIQNIYFNKSDSLLNFYSQTDPDAIINDFIKLKLEEFFK